ncbi:MAG: PQQ-binding-like beta-propeller repeat protein [Candidatus Competibacteraceae bacterium]
MTQLLALPPLGGNQVLGGWVYALVVSGNTVYVGGEFDSIGGQARNHLAALDANTGAATAWNPSPDGYRVSTLAIAGNTVYAGEASPASAGERVITSPRSTALVPPPPGIER